MFSLDQVSVLFYVQLVTSTFLKIPNHFGRRKETVRLASNAQEQKMNFIDRLRDFEYYFPRKKHKMVESPKGHIFYWWLKSSCINLAFLSESTLNELLTELIEESRDLNAELLNVSLLAAV